MRYNPDILVKIAIGDAFGVAVEYVDPGHPNYELALQFDHYYPHPRWKMGSKVGVGRYTDDTAMSIGTAEVILAGPPYTKEKFAKSFFDVYKRDPRPGYASGFQSLLNEVESWEELLDKLIPNSDKNGAAMRSVPLGVLDNPEEILRVAQTQAAITHNTPGGIISSQVIALISHYALYDIGPLEINPLVDWLDLYLPKEVMNIFRQPWKGALIGPAIGIKTAYAAMSVITTQKTLLDVLRNVVEISGDCDTLAAICLGIASSRMTEPLPNFMESELEVGGKYGPTFLRNLGDRLIRPFYQKSFK